MTKTLLPQKLIERHGFEGRDQLQGLPGRKTSHAVEDGGHGWLLGLDQRPDVELERRKGGGVHETSLREQDAIALIRIKPTTTSAA